MEEYLIKCYNSFTEFSFFHPKRNIGFTGVNAKFPCYLAKLYDTSSDWKTIRIYNNLNQEKGDAYG